MPKFKTLKIQHRNGAGVEDTLCVDVQLSSAGLFYANLPECLRVAFDGSLVVRSPRTPSGLFKAESATLQALEDAIRSAYIAFMAPEVTEEPVIRYNIESHVSFAVDQDGKIVPNAGYPGATWVERGPASRGPGAALIPSYGDHHATSPARNGYSLAIGARAMLRRTHRFGDKTRVEYENYYKGGSHLSRDNPAQLLNSWAAMGLGDAPKEIPYTDEAALFFHRLLLGMAELSRRVQEATFTQERLTALIASSANGQLLGFAAPAATDAKQSGAELSGKTAAETSASWAVSTERVTAGRC